MSARSHQMGGIATRGRSGRLSLPSFGDAGCVQRAAALVPAEMYASLRCNIKMLSENAQ